MENLTFDGMPNVVAILNTKTDTIINLLTNLVEGKIGPRKHTPIGLSEAAKMLGKSLSTVYEMTSRRKVPFHKRGNGLYFFEDELLKWIESAGCSEAVYPEDGKYGQLKNAGNLNMDGQMSIDDLKAEQHLKTLQKRIGRKSKSLL